MLSVRSVSGEELSSVSKEKCRSVLELKEHLRKELGFPVCLQQLVADGTCLEDSMDAPDDSCLVRSAEIREDQQDAAGNELVLAAASGLLETVRFLLQAGMDRDWVDEHDFSALMHAADAGHSELVQLLVEAGADKDLQDDEGLTALMLAASRGHADVVQLLIAAGASKNVRDEKWRTALMHAAAAGFAEVARLLVETGADIDLPDVEGYLKILHMLIDLGVDKDVRDEESGMTVLMSAADAGHSELVQLLVEAGADKDLQNYEGRTALMLAAESGKTAIVRFLVDSGADVGVRDECYGEMALMKAVLRGHSEIVRLLLNAGSHIGTNAWDDHLDDALAKAAVRGSCSIVRMLLEAGADMDAIHENGGTTALMWAAAGGHADVVKLLVDAGADKDVRDHAGMTASAYAQREGFDELEGLLCPESFHLASDTGAKHAEQKKPLDEAVQDGLPPFLCSLLAYSNTHDDDMETLKKEISFVEDEKQRYTWSLHLHKDDPAGRMHRKDPAVLARLMTAIATMIIDNASGRYGCLDESYRHVLAPGKRTKPMHKIYERFFGIDGSLYVFKVAVLQLFTVLLQSCGKLALLVLNSLYPAALIVFRDWTWQGLPGTLEVATDVIKCAQTVVGLSRIDVSARLVKQAWIPGGGEILRCFEAQVEGRRTYQRKELYRYLSVYISLVHICCVCRALEDAAAKFIMWSPDNFSETLPEPPHRRTRSSQSLSTTALTMRHLATGMIKRTGGWFLRSLTLGRRLKVATGNVVSKLGEWCGARFALSLTRNDWLTLKGIFAPLHQELLSRLLCPPSMRSPSSGTYLLTSCELASVLRFLPCEIHPRVFKKFGPDLLATRWLGSKVWLEVPFLFRVFGFRPKYGLSLFDGTRQQQPRLSELRLLDLGRCKISSLTDDVFVGLETIVLGNPLSTLPPGLFDNMDSLQLVDVRLTSLPPKLFNSISKLRALELQDNLLEEIAPEAAVRALLCFGRFPVPVSGGAELTDLDLSNNLLGSGALPSLQGGSAPIRNLNAYTAYTLKGAFSGLLALQWLDISKISLKGFAFNVIGHGYELNAVTNRVFDPLEKLRSKDNSSEFCFARLNGSLFRNLSQLRILDLSANQLDEVAPESFAGLSGLVPLAEAQAHLILAHNLLTNLTRDLSFNPLHDLRALLPWSLQSLILRLGSDMNLAEIDDDCLTNATLLEVLDIGGNVLTELPPLGWIEGQSTMHGGTPLTGVKGGEEQTRLLDLSDNELSDLHPGLFRSLSDNELKVLPCLLFCAVLQPGWNLIACAMVGRICLNVCFTTIYVALATVFPESSQKNVLPLCQITARVGGILAPMSGTLPAAVSCPAFGSLCMLAVVATLTLPERIGEEA
ncbi:Ankyrin repeat domain-containing protein 50 [Symbiodinium microadriaticum]|uniref:Ankyrin repeat domain-containing protein 50 n=1 Tax=Symbiodinium microadriaticum TaxID=2951 RepID=A0A1Q9F5T7_SYMMI|nr:Ankyrin repeat domain-containing protein 50 [Symbiodinium microadriaticum]